MASTFSVFSGRVHYAGLSVSARPAHTVRQLCVVRASTTEVPANVAEARAWIAAWRAKQQGAAEPQPATVAAAAPTGNGKPSQKQQPKAKATPASNNKFQASQSMADGTLVFTADQLKSVDYNDILKK